MYEIAGACQRPLLVPEFTLASREPPLDTTLKPETSTAPRTGDICVKFARSKRTELVDAVVAADVSSSASKTTASLMP